MGYEILLTEAEMFAIEHPIWNFLIFAGNSAFDTSLNLIMILFFIRLLFISFKLAFSKGNEKKLARYKVESKYLLLGLFLEITLKILMNYVFEGVFEK